MTRDEIEALVPGCAADLLACRELLGWTPLGESRDGVRLSGGGCLPGDRGVCCIPPDGVAVYMPYHVAPTRRLDDAWLCAGPLRRAGGTLVVYAYSDPPPRPWLSGCRVLVLLPGGAGAVGEADVPALAIVRALLLARLVSQEGAGWSVTEDDGEP